MPSRALTAWTSNPSSRKAFDAALADAIARWGPSRVGSITLSETWQTSAALADGPGYDLDDREGAGLGAALRLLELDVADAVVLTHAPTSVLLERVARGGLRLESGLVDCDHVLDAAGNAPTRLAELGESLLHGAPIPQAPDSSERVGVRTPSGPFTVSLPT